jgi:phage terminase Nu1 subunit (DNA packaging protein)
MDNVHYSDSHHNKISREQRQLPNGDALPELPEEVERLLNELRDPENADALPELPEEVERLLEELQKQEVDVDRHTLQRVLDYARKA